MASDFNVTVVAVDETMSAFEGYLAELSDIRAKVMFETESLFSEVRYALSACEEEIEGIESAIAHLCESEECENDAERFEREYERLRCELSKKMKKQAALEELSHKCEGRGRMLREEFAIECGRAKTAAEDALSFMGRYIHDINLVTDNKDGIYRASGVYVCVLDSSLHPESAEHIRRAVMRGQPSVVTIDREGAAARRDASLRNVGVRSEFDRDEYPMAMFKEGGDGADVFYLTPSDNRGAGAYISRQLRSLPSGARVRIRVV